MYSIKYNPESKRQIKKAKQGVQPNQPRPRLQARVDGYITPSTKDPKKSKGGDHLIKGRGRKRFR